MLGELCGVAKIPLVSEYIDIRLGGVVDGPMSSLLVSMSKLRT